MAYIYDLSTLHVVIAPSSTPMWNVVHWVVI